MPHTLEEVRQIALELSEQDRCELAHSLWESVETDLDVDEAWKIEVESRADALDSGAVAAVSWEKAQAEFLAMRAQLKSRR